jgi:hypothetical protein
MAKRRRVRAAGLAGGARVRVRNGDVAARAASRWGRTDLGPLPKA